MIQRKDALPEVQPDIELAQEIQSNKAINAVFFGEGVAQGFNILHPGISQTQRFQSHLGDNVSLGGIAKGSEIACCFEGVANGT